MGRRRHVGGGPAVVEARASSRERIEARRGHLSSPRTARQVVVAMGVRGDQQDGPPRALPAHGPSVAQDRHATVGLRPEEMHRDLGRRRHRRGQLLPDPELQVLGEEDLAAGPQLRPRAPVEGLQPLRDAQAHHELRALEPLQRLGDPDPAVHLTRDRDALERGPGTGHPRRLLGSGQAPEQGVLVQVEVGDGAGPDHRPDRALRSEEDSHRVEGLLRLGHGGEVEPAVGALPGALEDGPLRERDHRVAPHEGHGDLRALERANAHAHGIEVDRARVERQLEAHGGPVPLEHDAARERRIPGAARRHRREPRPLECPQTVTLGGDVQGEHAGGSGPHVADPVHGEGASESHGRCRGRARLRRLGRGLGAAAAPGEHHQGQGPGRASRRPPGRPARRACEGLLLRGRPHGQDQCSPRA